jgi:hypothetical protein
MAAWSAIICASFLGGSTAFVVAQELAHAGLAALLV